MRMIVLTLGLSVAAPLAAQQPAPPPPSQKDIVVTGRRLKDTEDALAACIARHCPPDQDIAATLAHAENEFVAGGYKDARRTLLASIGRNKGQGKRYPVPLGDLYRASSRVAVHLGESDSYRANTFDSLDALKAGLPADDPRVFAERIEVGDMFAHIGKPDAALSMYAAAARDAKAKGQPGLAATARLRTVSLDMHLGEQAGKGSGEWRDALRSFDALAADTDPAMKNAAFVARVMKAQMLARYGDNTALDAVMAEMRARGGQKRPVLLSSKPIAGLERPELVTINNQIPFRSSTALMPVGRFDGQWVDVAFWIKPDGTVSDADTVRTSEHLDKEWVKPVLASVNSRKYAPLALPADDPGLLRVERYTYTSFFDNTVSGTRLRTRSGEPKIEILDLTEDPGKTG